MSGGTAVSDNSGGIDPITAAQINNAVSDNSSHGERTLILVIVGIFFLSMIVFIIYLFECYKKQTFLFKSYVAPGPPTNGFEPLGVITSLTPDQQAARKAALTAAVNAS